MKEHEQQIRNSKEKGNFLKSSLCKKQLGALLLLLSTFAWGENLIVNGDFEQGIRGWGWETWREKKEPGEIERANPYSGKLAYRMFREGDNANSLLQQIHKFDASQNYTLSLMVKSEGALNNDVKVKILCNGMADGKSKTLGWAQNPSGSGVVDLIVTGGTHDWKKISVKLNSSCFRVGTQSVYLFIQRGENGSGSVWLDDIMLEKDVAETVLTTMNQTFVAGVNLLPHDTSFETGESGWRGGVRDTTRGIHGNASLKIAAGQSRALSGYYFRVLQEKQSYMLSFYVTCDQLETITVAVGDTSYRGITRQKISVDSSWRRVVIPLPPQPNLTGIRVVIEKSEDANVWLDAMQLNQGNSVAAYSPSEKISATISHTTAPGDVLFPQDQPLKLALYCRNNTSAPVDAALLVKTEIANGSPSTVLTSQILLEPGRTVDYDFTALPRQNIGYYVCRAEVSLDVREKYSAVRSFAVVAEPPAAKEESFFGMHPIGPVTPEILRRIGVSWVRNFRMWEFTPKSAGKYQIPDSWWRDYVNNKINLMESIKVTMAPKNAFQADGKFKNIDDYSEYCRQLVDAYGEHTRHWEIENEPDLTIPHQLKAGTIPAAEYYAQIVNAAALAIRERQPEAIILAGGVSGVDFNRSYPFLQTVLKNAGKSIDIIPVHPYANARYIGPEESDIGPDVNLMYPKLLELQKIIREYGGKQDIWLGEIGWALDIEEDPSSPAAIRHADYLMRTMLLAKTAGAKKVMYFLSDSCLEKGRYYYGLWRNGVPLPAVAAYATAAHFLDSATTGPEIMQGRIRACGYFSADGKPFAAIWLEKGKPLKAMIKLDYANTEVRDMFNRPIKLSAVKPEPLMLSGSPIFIQTPNLTMGQLTEIIRTASYDCPPVNCDWRVVDTSSVELQIQNALSAAQDVNIMLSAPGITFLNPDRQFNLAPGASTKLHFTTKDSVINHKNIAAEIVTSAGRISSSFVVNLNPCHYRNLSLDGSFSQCRGLPEIVMNSRDHLLPNDPEVGWSGQDDLSVNAALAWDENNLYLFADVKDDIHSQKYFAGQLWAGDSIQLAIDTKANAAKELYQFDRDDYELSFGLTTKGSEAEVTYMYESGRQDKLLKNIRLGIVRQEGKTIYKIAIPWADLNLKPRSGMVFGLNFIVNDNDGHGRQYWLGMTPGIGEMKAPFLYRKFYLEK